jgi:mutator family transposase
VRDREAAAADPDRIRFTPAILPPYLRRSKSVEALLPPLYLKGISTGDFSEALAALFGKDAVGLGIDDWPPKGGVAGGACAMAEA